MKYYCTRSHERRSAWLDHVGQYLHPLKRLGMPISNPRPHGDPFLCFSPPLRDAQEQAPYTRSVGQETLVQAGFIMMAHLSHLRVRKGRTEHIRTLVQVPGKSSRQVYILL
jgi:hypothetical protein